MAASQTHVDRAFGRLLQVSRTEGDLLLLSGAEHRGLASARGLEASETVFSLPWSSALTEETAVHILRRDERHRRGFVPGGIAGLQAALSSSSVREITSGSSWMLWLVLQLLRELRVRGSTLQPYVEMLPAPPGSLVKAVCCWGPDASDLLLFSDAELLELQNAALTASVQAEKQRLRSLHKRIFCNEGQEAMISLHSFTWAHALVRSRCLDLMGAQEASNARGEPFRAHCMLPVIDLCNHGGMQANCHLAVRMDAHGHPRYVDVIAKGRLAPGEELLLDYGNRTLQDFVQGYAFTPLHHRQEIYADFGATWECLYLRGSPQGAMFWLNAVHIESESIDRGRSENTSLLYTVQDDAASRSDPSTCCSRLARLGSHVEVFYLDEQEGHLALHVAEEAELFLSNQPTTLGEDMHLLQCNLSSRLKQDLDSRFTAMLGPEDRKWLREQHARIAITYRAARKSLLARVASDLRSQAWLLMNQ